MWTAVCTVTIKISDTFMRAYEKPTYDSAKEVLNPKNAIETVIILEISTTVGVASIALFGLKKDAETR